MAGLVAFWADSTYGCIEPSRLMEIAGELGFPLASFTCTYGAGLATHGDESGKQRSVAPNIIIEMGCNDDAGLTPDDAVKRMRKQSWFTCLSSYISTVGRVIFIAQPGYRQAAGFARKQKKKSEEIGQLIEGSAWTGEAARLVREELGIDTVIFDVAAEEIYVGFVRNDRGELSQDEAACRSYKDHGVEYSENGKPALW